MNGDVEKPEELGRRSALSAVVFLGVANTVVLSIIFALKPDLLSKGAQEVFGYLVKERWGELSIGIGVLALVFVVEAVVMGWRQSSLALLARPTRSMLADLWIFLLRIGGLGPIVMVACTFGVSYVLERYSGSIPWSGSLTKLGLPTWAAVVVVFLAVDLLDYWLHRWCHEVEFLWKAHRYHHAATSFVVITGSRIHVLEDAVRHAFLAFPVAILGDPHAMIFPILLARAVIDQVQHSMLPWTYGWFGRLCFFSPIGHRIHHSPDPDHWDKNYGNFLVIWDRLFGTWYDGEKVNQTVGLQSNPYHSRGFVTEYLATITATAREFWQSLRSGHWKAVHRRGH